VVVPVIASNPYNTAVKVQQKRSKRDRHTTIFSDSDEDSIWLKVVLQPELGSLYPCCIASYAQWNLCHYQNHLTVLCVRKCLNHELLYKCGCQQVRCSSRCIQYKIFFLIRSTNFDLEHLFNSVNTYWDKYDHMCYSVDCKGHDSIFMFQICKISIFL
jgi:hypothetical protein